MIRWITPRLGTGAYGADPLPDGATCIDVRLLADGGGNADETFRKYVGSALEVLRQNGVAVICCDHGISRSNTIAAVVLSQLDGISLPEAIRRVSAATDHAELNLGLLQTVQSLVPSSNKAPCNRERWLLTGGTGYLGRALRASVPSTVELLAPSRTDMDLSVSGVGLELAVHDWQIRGILHFASPRIGNTNSSIGEYLSALRNVLEVCANNRIPVMLPSRVEVFAGYKGREFLADESTERRPAGAMGDRCFLTEELVERFAVRNDVEATILRTSLIYGGRGGPNFLRGFLKSAIGEGKITTHWCDNGEPKVDLLHIDDWVGALWGLQQQGMRGLYHCGSGNISGTTEIAKMIAERIGSHVKVNSLPLHVQVAKVGLDSRRLHDQTGWVPSISLEAGLAKWMLENSSDDWKKKRND